LDPTKDPEAAMNAPTHSVIASIYESKPATYYGNSRDDIVAKLKTGPRSAILELGCGAGGTGRAALAAGKAGHYMGVELSESAAARAKEQLSEVLVGDVQAMDLTPYAGQFDALIVSEVLEHLTDPWTTLRNLVACLKPGAEVHASSPNVSYHGVIRNLVLGRFPYAEKGIMDRTHLRWYTPASFREMFEDAGVQVDAVRPMREPGWKGQMLNAVTGRRFQHVLWAQMLLSGRKRPT